jgi:hypothetical protein
MWATNSASDHPARGHFLRGHVRNFVPLIKALGNPFFHRPKTLFKKTALWASYIILTLNPGVIAASQHPEASYLPEASHHPEAQTIPEAALLRVQWPPRRLRLWPLGGREGGGSDVWCRFREAPCWPYNIIKFSDKLFISAANPTIACRSATSSQVRFENKNIFFYNVKCSCLLRRWRCI